MASSLLIRRVITSCKTEGGQSRTCIMTDDNNNDILCLMLPLTLKRVTGCPQSLAYKETRSYSQIHLHTLTNIGKKRRHVNCFGPARPTPPRCVKVRRVTKPLGGYRCPERRNGKIGSAATYFLAPIFR